GPAPFTPAANGNPSPTVQWEVSTDNGATYTPVTGATADTLTFTAAANQNGNLYEAVFSNAVGSATTAAARLTVQTPPAITTAPSSATVTAGQSATFTAAANGNPSPMVQWEVSTDGGATYHPDIGRASCRLS